MALNFFPWKIEYESIRRRPVLADSFWLTYKLFSLNRLIFKKLNKKQYCFKILPETYPMIYYKDATDIEFSLLRKDSSMLTSSTANSAVYSCETKSC